MEANSEETDALEVRSRYGKVDTEDAIDWVSGGARIFGILSEEGAGRSGVEALSGDVMKSSKRPSA